MNANLDYDTHRFQIGDRVRNGVMGEGVVIALHTRTSFPDLPVVRREIASYIVATDRRVGSVADFTLDAVR